MWKCEKGHYNVLPPCVFNFKIMVCVTCQREDITAKLVSAGK